MSLIDRYKAYADAFEESYADDDWSRIADYFTEDAQYDGGTGDPAVGRDALLEKLKTGVDAFDRRMDSRNIEFVGEPREADGKVTTSWKVTYTLAGAPDLVISGTETATFEGDRIRLLADEFDAAANERLGKWMEAHGAALARE
jgi:hypothetical protein